MQLQLHLHDIYQEQQYSRPETTHRLLNSSLLRKSLDTDIISSCLNSFNVFKDLLVGLREQKNLIIRDICRNIDLKYYRDGDIVYDVGDKVGELYFCISGKVSICILEQIQKDVLGSLRQLLPTDCLHFKQSQVKITSNIYQNSLHSLTAIPVAIEQQQPQLVQKQIYLLQSGEGFGESQFISGTNRKLRAVIKQDSSLIGKLQLEYFTQVIENYKHRVYYKKRDMFQKCALFSKLHPKKLQFIINNTKPMTLQISDMLVREGEEMNLVYLVNKGQISLWMTGIEIDRENDSEEQNQENGGSEKMKKDKERNSNHSKLQKYQSSGSSRLILGDKLLSKGSKSEPRMRFNMSKHRLEKVSIIPQENQNKVFMGELSQGCFIGDMQLVMGIPYKFNAICKSKQAQLYFCDKRIILSQMSESELHQAIAHYQAKQHYQNQKISKYKTAKQKIERRRIKEMLPPLTKLQILLKRKIMHRHTEDKPSLIGHCSPRDIAKMIARKQCRVVKQPENSKYPIFQLFANYSVKKRSKSSNDRCSFNPVSLVKIKSRNKKTGTQPGLYETLIQKQKPSQQGTQEDLQKFQSLIIQLRPIKTTLKNLESQRQRSIVDVAKILNRHRHCDSRMRQFAEVIGKVERQQR